MRTQGSALRVQPWAPITTPSGGREIVATVAADGSGDGVDEMGTGRGLIGREVAVVEVVEQPRDGDQARVAVNDGVVLPHVLHEFLSGAQGPGIVGVQCKMRVANLPALLRSDADKCTGFRHLHPTQKLAKWNNMPKQLRGYGLLHRPDLDVSEYETSWIAQENAANLRELRAGFPSINPKQYRGMSRDMIIPFPSLEPSMIEAFAETGLDMKSNARARRRFREIIGEDTPDDLYDECLVPDLVTALEIRSLLDSPEEYEIVMLSREDSAPEVQTLGFDIGYWGGDHFSLICDLVVMPRWHPPPPEDFAVLASELTVLNDNLLFADTRAAAEFRAFYKRFPWAESEHYPGQFAVIEVSIPDVSARNGFADSLLTQS
jgi:hypothetical protein